MRTGLESEDILDAWRRLNRVSAEANQWFPESLSVWSDGIHIAAQIKGTPRDRGGTSIRMSTKDLSIAMAAGSVFLTAIHSLAAEVISEQKVSARRTVQLSPLASELEQRCIEIPGPTLNAISRFCDAAADLVAAGAFEGSLRPSCRSLHRSA